MRGREEREERKEREKRREIENREEKGKEKEDRKRERERGGGEKEGQWEDCKYLALQEKSLDKGKIPSDHTLTLRDMDCLSTTIPLKTVHWRVSQTIHKS